MAHLVGKFVWFEHVSKDAKKAQSFYGEVFGWKVQEVPMGPGSHYAMATAAGKTVAGYATPQGDAPAHWISYASVSDVDQTVKQAVAAGAKALGSSISIPGFGRMARLEDPTGAAFDLWSAERGDDPDLDSTAGQFTWNELWTADPAKALAFYTKVLGYETRDMDMGPMGTYHLLKAAGRDRGGVMKSTEPKAPPMWLPYVHVDDADRTVARVKQLGGTVHKEPFDIPEVGRIAIFADSVGAVIALLQPSR